MFSGELVAPSPVGEGSVDAPLRLGEGAVYGLRAQGPWAPHQGHRFNPAKLLLDPYAREVVGRYGFDAQGREADLTLYLGHDPHDPTWPDERDNAAVALKARVPAAAPVFDWQDDRAPRVPPGRTVLYELHVKGATRLHPGIPPALQGTYAGLGHPALVSHLQALGVTTVSLMPVHARADEQRLQQQGLSNYWGYSSIAFLAPEPRYAQTPGQAGVQDEFKTLVRTLHRAGIEVVLDVVFNHSGETDELGPTLSLRGLANRLYYVLEPGDPSRYVNWTGCGNCLDLTQPRVVELVVAALRHWVREMHVDGFRFDLAPVLARSGGRYDACAPFFAALRADELLSRVKLIAEPWDIGPDGYQLGRFPPGWLEWNDRYRDTVRGFWLHAGSGPKATRGDLARGLAASSDRFRHDWRQPAASVNYICAHDGFTLRDLVSYDHRHNEANGEDNRDGHGHNLSWNAGFEGPGGGESVQALRARLQRALLATLLVSQGTPMLLGGDELGHSQSGNNNAYCQDNATTWWDWAGADTALLAFVRRALAVRHGCPALRIAHWLEPLDLAAWQAGAVQSCSAAAWLRHDGQPLGPADWDQAEQGTLAVLLHWAGDAHAVSLPDRVPATALLLFNADAVDQAFDLPMPQPGQLWLPLLASDSADGEPADGRAWPRTLTLPPRCLRVAVAAQAP